MENIRVIFEDSNQFIRILNWVIPFILGLFSSLIVDYLRNYFSRKHKKKLVIDFLKNQILVSIPKLIEDAEKTISMLNAEANIKFRLGVYISFNRVVLDSVTQIDYHRIFKQKYNTFVDVYSLIKFFESNFPSQIHDEYIRKVESHLKDMNKVGEIEHTRICNTCQGYKWNAIKLLEFRINELKILESKIKELIQ